MRHGASIQAQAVSGFPEHEPWPLLRFCRCLVFWFDDFHLPYGGSYPLDCRSFWG